MPLMKNSNATAMQQLAIPEIETVGDSLTIQIYRDGPERYCATIAGGWWAAYGRTPEVAAKNVKRQYENEQETTK